MFSWTKAVGKFLLGAIGAGVGIIAADPSIITRLIPEQWASLTLAGLAVELIDYIHNRLTK